MYMLQPTHWVAVVPVWCASDPHSLYHGGRCPDDGTDGAPRHKNCGALNYGGADFRRCGLLQHSG